MVLGWLGSDKNRHRDPLVMEGNSGGFVEQSTWTVKQMKIRHKAEVSGFHYTKWVESFPQHYPILFPRTGRNEKMITLFVKCTIQWFFNTVTELCSHTHCLSSYIFIIPKETVPVPTTPQPFLWHPLATTNLHSVSLDLPVTGHFHECNHTICGLLRLASFIVP